MRTSHALHIYHSLAASRLICSRTNLHIISNCLLNYRAFVHRLNTMSSIQATEKSDMPKDLKVRSLSSPSRLSVTKFTQSLVASSEPDKSAPSTYEGPPIGYGARVVEHTSAAGTTTVYGNVIVPRPRYVQRCVYESCEYCKVCTLTLSSAERKIADLLVVLSGRRSDSTANQRVERVLRDACEVSEGETGWHEARQSACFAHPGHRARAHDDGGGGMKRRFDRVFRRGNSTS